MKILCLFIFFLIAQESNPKPKKEKDCTFNFENDLKANSIKLFLIGGIAPVHVQRQEVHEKKFGFTYYDYGCLPEEESCIKYYSMKAFRYLDGKYGKSWRKQVRSDVLYLKGKNHL